LAASLERSRGDRAVVDPGARRDLAQSLAEGLRAHADAVAARLPGATVVVQVDEPSLPAVLQGGLPTTTGFGKLAAVEEPVVLEETTRFLADLGAGVDRPVVVHCCAAGVPLGLLRAAGAAAVSLDLGLVRDLDAVGEAVDAGTHLLLGVVPGTDRALPAPKATAARLHERWNELGFPAEQLHTSVTLTPTCGLAGASPAYARAAMAHVREAARYLLPD
jgi:methionine synthase II (cobalamin-independent)